MIEGLDILLLSNSKSLIKVLSSGESGEELNEEKLAASLKSGVREDAAIDDVDGGAWNSGWRNLALVVSCLSVSIASGFLNLFVLVLRAFGVLSSNTKGCRNFVFGSFF